MMFSFVIPVYRTEAFLPRCLDSLTAQTDGDFEVIVVDDCSPTQTAAEIVAHYDRRFRLVVQPKNASAYQARIRGMREACGDYVCFADPDDYVLPDLVERLKGTLRDGDTDMIVYNCERDARSAVSAHWCRYGDEELSADEMLRRMADGRQQWNVWTKCIRRTCCLRALAAQPYAARAYVNSSDDFGMLVPILLECRTVRTIGAVGYRYCANDDSTTGSQRTLRGAVRAIVQTLRAWRLVRRYVRERGCGDACRLSVNRIAGRIIRWIVHDWRTSHWKGASS